MNAAKIAKLAEAVELQRQITAEDETLYRTNPDRFESQRELLISRLALVDREIAYADEAGQLLPETIPGAEMGA